MRTDNTGTGALGLPFNEVGEAVQSLASVIVDREEATLTEVITATTDFDEGAWWESIGGPTVDHLTKLLFEDKIAAAREPKPQYLVAGRKANLVGIPWVSPMFDALCSVCGRTVLLSETVSRAKYDAGHIPICLECTEERDVDITVGDEVRDEALRTAMQMGPDRGES